MPPSPTRRTAVATAHLHHQRLVEPPSPPAMPPPSPSHRHTNLLGAMELATGALGTLLPKLAQLLHGEYQLQKNVRKNIEFLTKELETTQAALRVIGEVPTEQLNELVRIWARDARELSYDMEDVVDTFLVRVDGPNPPSKRSSKRFIQKMRSMLAIGKRHDIGEQVEDIKERVVELAARRDRCKVDTVNYHITSVDPRIKALYVKTTELVGIEKARKEIILELTKGDDMSSQVQKIVSIVGFGGLGKTTLAKAVYEEIESQFDCTAFVTVSRNPDIKKFLKDMLYELDKGKYGNIHSTSLDVNHLIDLVRGFISNKRMSTFFFQYEYASEDEVEEAIAAVRKEAEIHPNSPTLEMYNKGVSLLKTRFQFNVDLHMYREGNDHQLTVRTNWPEPARE
ncbi:hypothetical protein PR202_ga22536 [Eleusine coracana subsp. coracana]|uniref:Uncharacterized protein n=1 Tax=Eleusine coracana subsp. coracana TaxID=191504 RepID=A0AAV5D3H0_ELECO|nr:hypothetical protein PR202_ga22536 [Eleusine coracana subsp. coracana]